MPTIIDKSIFQLELAIPNSQSVPSIGITPTNQDKLTLAIEKYERLLLVNALGITQYNELKAALTETSGKWYDLINGVSNFEGIKPIIARYVYVNFLKYDQSVYATTGMERANAQNATNVLHTERLIDFWNTFVYMYQGYNSCCVCPPNGVNRNMISLYEYLVSRPDDYSISNFCIYQIQNVLGL